MLKVPKYLNTIDFTMVLRISTCKVYAKNIQMHLNTSPTCFEGPRGSKIGFRDTGPDKIGFRCTVRNLASGADLEYVIGKPVEDSVVGR